MKHAHAELLHRLAEDCTLNVWVWIPDAPPNEYWYQAQVYDVANDKKGQWRYALGDKPTSPPKKCAMVEGVRVPMTHLTVAPGTDEPYWYIGAYWRAHMDKWHGGTFDNLCLSACNCYATEADAQEAATAWAQVRKNAAERAK